MSRKLLKCPVCGHPVQLNLEEGRPRPPFPFCSERCRLIDLGRWLGERYRVPAVEPDEAAELEDLTDRSGQGEQGSSSPQS